MRSRAHRQRDKQIDQLSMANKFLGNIGIRVSKPQDPPKQYFLNRLTTISYCHEMSYKFITHSSSQDVLQVLSV